MHTPTISSKGTATAVPLANHESYEGVKEVEAKDTAISDLALRLSGRQHKPIALRSSP
jgi:hypothetical protein